MSIFDDIEEAAREAKRASLRRKIEEKEERLQAVIKEIAEVETNIAEKETGITNFQTVINEYDDAKEKTLEGLNDMSQCLESLEIVEGYSEYITYYFVGAYGSARQGFLMETMDLLGKALQKKKDRLEELYNLKTQLEADITALNTELGAI